MPKKALTVLRLSYSTQFQHKLFSLYLVPDAWRQPQVLILLVWLYFIEHQFNYWFFCGHCGFDFYRSKILSTFIFCTSIKSLEFRFKKLQLNQLERKKVWSVELDLVGKYSYASANYYIIWPIVTKGKEVSKKEERPQDIALGHAWSIGGGLGVKCFEGNLRDLSQTSGGGYQNNLVSWKKGGRVSKAILKLRSTRIGDRSQLKGDGHWLFLWDLFLCCVGDGNWTRRVHRVFF